tara:strand:+ start:3641 stop:4060 length:420 start_codon:yes stop_codon:yes gene_type:complete
MSKNLSLEKLLFAEILLNLPFFIAPNKLKSLKGIPDLVLKFFIFISISLLKFLSRLSLFSDKNNFNKFVESYLSPVINILFLKLILKLLFSFPLLKVFKLILDRFIISFLLFKTSPSIKIKFLPSAKFIDLKIKLLFLN